MNQPTRIAIIGGGPSGLFMCKCLIEAEEGDYTIDIFEKTSHLGHGMPYGPGGANPEHVTNISGNEIPAVLTPISEWIQSLPEERLRPFAIGQNFNDYKVLPRLLFGEYLSDQFSALLQKAKAKGITCTVHYNTLVADIIDHADRQQVDVVVADQPTCTFDHVVICTGHHWPLRYEGRVAGYFDSPYPPSKLSIQTDHPVAIRGSSLTAVDAIRTLARQNGAFQKNDKGKVTYSTHRADSKFRIVMHTRQGMLPAVRFHLDDTHLRNDSIMDKEELYAHINANDGFLSLDFIFEKDFKDLFLKKDPEFHALIRDMTVEDFVQYMMDFRKSINPFDLLRGEYAEAEKSIKRKQSIYWKELLGTLSFAMNYPAKHLSAEDMIRLQKVLLPLISIVIAYIPQGSTEELLALHDAGLLDLVTVGADSQVSPLPEGGIVYAYTDENDVPHAPHFHTFVDCIGQPHLSYEQFPFKSLLGNGTLAPARLRFRSASAGQSMLAAAQQEVEVFEDAYYLRVSGIAINDHFQAADRYGAGNERIYLMAVPYIGGYNPDYSGLDFCEAASEIIAQSIGRYDHGKRKTVYDTIGVKVPGAQCRTA